MPMPLIPLFQPVFVGFGEAAGAFAAGWAFSDPAKIRAFDIKSTDPATRAAQQDRYRQAGVTGCADLAGALSTATGVFCLITADQALEATRAAAPHLPQGAFWFDGNSCAPDTKRDAAKVIGAAGGRYVDMAIMAPVYTKRHLVPLLLAGPDAEAGAEALRSLGMQPRVTGTAVGHASSIKMIRSVMIKGMEALTAECFLAARRAGVEAEVLASLMASNPETDWPTRGAYNLERMMVHGARRAAEMREVANTVAALGLGSGMASATADWQDRVAATHSDPGADDLVARADAILARL